MSAFPTAGFPEVVEMCSSAVQAVVDAHNVEAQLAAEAGRAAVELAALARGDARETADDGDVEMESVSSDVSSPPLSEDDMEEVILGLHDDDLRGLEDYEEDIVAPLSKLSKVSVRHIIHPSSHLLSLSCASSLLTPLPLSLLKPPSS